jgi:CRISPR-associated protein Cas2
VNCIVVYDISDDGLRLKVADICLDYGLRRIQLSAFLGEMSTNRQQELLQKIARRAGKRQVKVHVFPLCERDFRLRRELVRDAPAV